MTSCFDFYYQSLQRLFGCGLSCTGMGNFTISFYFGGKNLRLWNQTFGRRTTCFLARRNLTWSSSWCSILKSLSRKISVCGRWRHQMRWNVLWGCWSCFGCSLRSLCLINGGSCRLKAAVGASLLVSGSESRSKTLCGSSQGQTRYQAPPSSESSL